MFVILSCFVALIMFTLRGPLQTSKSDKLADSFPLRAKSLDVRVLGKSSSWCKNSDRTIYSIMAAPLDTDGANYVQEFKDISLKDYEQISEGKAITIFIDGKGNYQRFSPLS
jgi:hypothetical protein